MTLKAEGIVLAFIIVACCVFMGRLETAHAQVPAGATPITLKQVNTLAGITTWTFSDSAGHLYYLQSAAYITIPVPAPGVWDASAPSTTPTFTPSADKTIIANNSGTIVDSSGGKWTIVNGVVELNGAAIGYSSGVTKLEIDGGTLWQQNTALNWYKWTASTQEWDGGAGPQ